MKLCKYGMSPVMYRMKFTIESKSEYIGRTSEYMEGNLKQYSKEKFQKID